MKILSIHADFIEFQALKKALKDAPEADKGKHRIEECLVIFTAAEKPDQENQEGTAEQLVKEITDISNQVNCKKIVLYPYAHLSSNLSTPKAAMEILKLAEKKLKKKYEVFRAPFGWYKSFDLKCKGHPLSELSREFGAASKTEEVSEALAAEKKLKSHWFILDTDGKEHPLSVEDGKVKGFDFQQWKNLKKYVNYELAKVRVAKKEPPHIALMRKLELVDYEPGSDPGNLRYYPKGRFIKALLEEFVTRETLAYGAMEIEAPIMYDFEHPALKSYLHRFPARQYTIHTPNKKVFLRFAACFGQFLIAHDATISYKDLPMSLFELTRYSFRVEQRGELTGLRRLRAFTMPDCHAFVADEEQAKQEFMKRVDLCWKVQEGIGFNPKEELEFALRITREFYDKHKAFVIKLVQKVGKPFLLEIWDERKFYFVFKLEWNFVDALDKAACLSTDQIDVENAERYGIVYTDKDNTKKFPLILHCSPSGAIERCIYALLEREAMRQQQGKPAMFPLWLSPTQVRIIPVSIESHLDHALKLAESLNKQGIRADCDDREQSVGKRIRASQVEWTPFTVVVGDKEVQGDNLMVRIRATGEEKPMKKEELIQQIKEKTKDLPFRPLPLRLRLSRRPIFVG